MFLVGRSGTGTDRSRSGRIGVIKFGGVVTAGVGAVVLSSGPGRTSPFARFTALVLEHLQPFDVVGVAEPELHPDERFSALDAEHVPRFRLRQELRDRTLRETENGFAEDLWMEKESLTLN